MLKQPNERKQFIITHEYELNIQNNLQENLNFPRWIETNHSGVFRPGLLLVASETLLVENFLVDEGMKLFITFGAGLPEISVDGLKLSIKLCFKEENEERQIVEVFHQLIESNQCDQIYSEEIDLRHYAGKRISFEFHCMPGPLENPLSDWLCFYELIICHKEYYHLNHARAFQAYRQKREIEFFSKIYQHPIYQDKSPSTGRNPQCMARNTNSQARKIHAYDYAHRELEKALPKKPIQFEQRMKELNQNMEAMRILSLCPGAGRVEAALINLLSIPTEVTMIDINYELLKKARGLIKPEICVELRIQDINRLDERSNQYDLILCVSALHHIVELENLLDFVRHNLKDTGEFWVLGEYIGRKGSRLYEEAYAIANGCFSNLNEKYRYNWVNKKIDKNLPNYDCSITTNEGIRSEEIMTLLRRNFSASMVYVRNCFLWRLMNLAYSDNYNVKKSADQKIIHHMVDLEVDYFSQGGKPTEMFGVFSNC